MKHGATAMAFVPVGQATTAAFRIRGGVINPQAAENAFTGGSPDPINLIPPEERFFVGGANTIRGYGENELGTRFLYENGEPVPDPRNPLRNAPPVRIGGRLLFLMNAELRRRLVGPLGVEIFFDAGNVWTRSTDIKVRNILSLADGAGYNDMRYTVGAGLRFATPIGPVRLDYGYKLRVARHDQADPTSRLDGNLHFSVGQAF